MHFASDNAGPVHPEVMDALAAANAGYAMPYGADAIMDGVRAKLRDIFETPEAAVYLVATGTAANVLALSCLARPYDSIFCSHVAHIEEDECNAPEFYSGGAKLTLVETVIDKMTPEGLDAAIAGKGNAVHQAQRGAVSITQVAEKGGVYSLDEIRALCDVAKRYTVPVHLDGARFANAAGNAAHIFSRNIATCPLRCKAIWRVIFGCALPRGPMAIWRALQMVCAICPASPLCKSLPPTSSSPICRAQRTRGCTLQEQNTT